MSIPPDSPWRGGAAFLSQPVTEEDVKAAEYVVETIYYFNVRCPVGTPLPDIEYRSSDGEIDILRHVFRWDRAPHDFVFQNGFEARRQEETPNNIFYDLERYVHSGGRPLDTRRATTHAFLSTTASSTWYPPPVNSGTVDRVYRYEIYAPGGILVSETLGDLYRYPAQAEVAFPAGIARQYIRSAQLFELASDRRYTRRTRVNNVLYKNGHFNPQSHPPRALRIQYPVSHYVDGSSGKTRVTRPLEIQMIDYYTEAVTDVDYYIDSAFRSTRRNEAYIFIKEEYVLINYAPGTAGGDRVVNGPHLIGSSFHSLASTVFAEYGIDAAFGCHGNEAMIFSGNLCARINYAPGTTDDSIIEGPKTIRQKFPFFKGTGFEGGIDAAFESTAATGQAYLFKGSEYALIDYSKPSLVAMRPLTEGFQCLRDTMFERNIGAAFASHVDNEAYLFKGNCYVLLRFTPGERGYIRDGPKEIVPANWPSLNGIVPKKNRGLDILDESPQPEIHHD